MGPAPDCVVTNPGIGICAFCDITKGWFAHMQSKAKKREERIRLAHKRAKPILSSFIGKYWQVNVAQYGTVNEKQRLLLIDVSVCFSALALKDS